MKDHTNFYGPYPKEISYDKSYIEGTSSPIWTITSSCFRNANRMSDWIAINLLVLNFTNFVTDKYKLGQNKKYILYIYNKYTMHYIRCKLTIDDLISNIASFCLDYRLPNDNKSLRVMTYNSKTNSFIFGMNLTEDPIAYLATDLNNKKHPSEFKDTEIIKHGPLNDVLKMFC